MTFGEVYTKIDKNLQKLNLTSAKNAQKLAKHLNNIFYIDFSNEENKRNKSFLQILFKEILDTVEGNADAAFLDAEELLASGLYSQEEKDPDKVKALLNAEITESIRTQQIHYSTVLKRVNEFKSILKEMQGSVPKGDTELDQKFKEMNQSFSDAFNKLATFMENNGYKEAAKELRSILKDGQISFKKLTSNEKMTTSEKEERNIGNILIKMAQIESALKYLQSHPKALPRTIYGDFFEYVLAFFSGKDVKNFEKECEDYGDNLAEKLLEEVGKIPNKKQSGINVLQGKKRQTGERFGNNLVQVKYDYTLNGSDKSKDPFRERQGKMDIFFNLPDENESKNYRISAKNWASNKDAGPDEPRTFGETSVSAALIRTLGPDDMTDYYFEPLWLMQQNNYFNFEDYDVYDTIRRSNNVSHELAQYSLLLDILMGYSQQNSYADVIVINNREKKEIQVIPISLVLKKINNNLSKLKLQDYNISQINKIIFNYFDWNKENPYYEIYRQLLDYKVALRYSDLEATLSGIPIVYGKNGISKPLGK